MELYNTYACVVLPSTTGNFTQSPLTAPASVLPVQLIACAYSHHHVSDVDHFSLHPINVGTSLWRGSPHPARYQGPSAREPIIQATPAVNSN